MNASKFQPIRFAATHPFAEIISAYRACNGNRAITFGEQEIWNPTGVPLSASHWSKLSDVICSTAEKPLRKDLLFDINWTRNLQLWSVVGAYTVEGKQLYSLHPSIAQEFLETDVDRVPGEMLLCPYKVIYLSWGKEMNLSVSPGVFLDGAYIIEANSAEIHCYPTAIDDSANYAEARKWMLQPEPCWDFRIKRHGTLDLESLLNACYQELEVWESEYQPGFEEFNRWLIDHNRAFFPLLRACIQLVVNSLLYFSAYPEDPISTWDEAPQKLVEEFQKTPFSKRKRITQKLVQEGYHFVKFVGSKLSYPSEPLPEANDLKSNVGKSEMPPHRRRGHLRLQPIGKERSERRLIWIRPTWVRADKGEVTEGRIYQIN